MSQPDLTAVLRAARPVAPPELRERVRQLSAEAAIPSRRGFTWRRAAIVLVPVAAAIAATVVFYPRSEQQAAVPARPVERAASTADNGAALQHLDALASKAAPAIPAPNLARPQRYSASLELRLATATAVSDATKRATQIVASLGGFPLSLKVNTGGREGYASLLLRVPRANVRTAISRLTALGTIVSENVSIQDLGAQVSATDRRIARLQARVTALRAQYQTTDTARQIASLTAQIEKLQRDQAATARAAHYATVNLQLTTPARVPAVHHGKGPLHGLGIAFHWFWIGAVYALALGAPVVGVALLAWLVARVLRRRRVDALLSRS